MKRHVLHPLWVTIALIAALLGARELFVPDDFGVHNESFTYSYHRLGNVQEWKEFPAKYQGRDSCTECHRDNVRSVRRSPHRRIECENCHGPAAGHPDEIEFLPRNTEREMCLRCHAYLEYPNTARNEIPPVKDRMHHRRKACVECHNPHQPTEYYE